jgi:hypothetical protein
MGIMLSVGYPANKQTPNGRNYFLTGREQPGTARVTSVH